MTRELNLSQIERGAEMRRFAEAVRARNSAQTGTDAFTASGSPKETINGGAGEDFIASGGIKETITHDSVGFTASGERKPINVAGDFTASGDGKRPT
jgi:hypothetical protein